MKELLIGGEGLVRIVTLNRPGVHNALSLAMLGGLCAALSSAERDGCACFIITNTGVETFSSGGHLREFGELKTREAAMEMSLQMQRFARAMRRSPLITIAAMEGGAYGGGLELALGADIRIASETAHFGFVQINLAITPAWRGISRALELIPRSRALLLMTTGEHFDVQAALAWGLIDRVAPKGGALAAALSLADTILARSPLAIRSIKRMIDSPHDDSDADLDREAADFGETWISDAHWNALRKRLNKEN